MLDLSYNEDVVAEVDMNIVMTGSLKFVEVQGTAEKTPFSDEELLKMLNLAKSAIKKLTEIQKEVLSDIWGRIVLI